MALKEVSGERENKTTVVAKKVNTYEHTLKISVNDMVKNAKENGVPMFIAYYSPTDGYVFNGVLPEEIINEDADVSSEYGKFNAFMRICMNYNREEFLGSEIIKTF